MFGVFKKMIIAGAGGHGLELYQVLIQQGVADSDIYFFDNDREKLSKKEINGKGIFEESEIVKHLKNDPRFLLGVGNPIIREKLFYYFGSIGGKYVGLNCTTSVNSRILIDNFDAFPFSFVGPSVRIGKGVLINTRAHVHHECSIGDFSEIGPGSMLLGASKIGSKCRIGAGAILLPGVRLGDEVIVGAGAIVTKSVMEKSVLVGIPAKPLS